MWDLPGSGLEPVSPAWAGGFLTTAPPGKSPDYLSFYLMFFFSSKIPPRTSHDISLSCHLGLLLAATVSQIFLVFDNLDSYEEDWSGIFVDRSLIWVGMVVLGVFVFVFFLMTRLVFLGSWGEDHRAKCHSHHITSRMPAVNILTTDDGNLDHLAVAVAARCLHWEGHLCPPFPRVLFGRSHKPTLKG